MKVLLAQPRGFCAGVTRAIAIVERALAIYGAPIYVRHEIVHNRTVVNSLRERGAVFVDNLAEVPEGATVVFSAHGVPRAVSEEAERRGFRVFDATCPLVTKVHREVARMRAEGRTVLMIGHAGHPEVEGTMGQVDGGIELVEICYATTNRQEAVKLLARSGVDIVLVIGSATSSNSNRLREVAEREGARAYLVDTAEHIDPKWFEGVACVGITAGASAPESLVQGVLRYLEANLNAEHAVALEGVEENVVFPLPKGLREEDAD